MSSTNLNSNHDLGKLGAKVVKLEQDFKERSLQQNEYPNFDFVSSKKSELFIRRQETEYNRRSTISNASVLDQERSLIDDSNFCSTSLTCPAPICREFWKAGNYEYRHSKPTYGSDCLCIHPKFLHSNATSHKWAFGAVAQLLDNSVDEIQNGASFVIVDKTSNPRDGTAALLIQDDGGGMDPEAMRRCLSFGFPDEKSKNAIGQRGNGFKTSSMRLGADVVVFSRSMRSRKLTQIVGLLSYTFLMQTRQDRIVVPMVDYQFDSHTGTWNTLHNEHHLNKDLSILLQWSPVTTESELLKQCDDIGPHGTKIIVYNLWHNDDGKMELDFESDPEDIRLSGEDNNTTKVSCQMEASELHLANHLKYSLRAYLSILYLRVPDNFSIFLRGRVVEYRNIANDLKFPEFILYRPKNVEGSVITTIGFLKEAPAVDVHGFNVYHKNRLILPFWHVVTSLDSIDRGIVGVLEANFIEPTLNKQEFEKTPVLQKLETRLKEMTQEYWDYHYGLIGYHQEKTNPRPNMVHHAVSDSRLSHGINQPVVLAKDSSGAIGAKASGAAGAIQEINAPSNHVQTKSGIPVPSFHRTFRGATFKRKRHDRVVEPERVKRIGGMGSRPIDSAHGEDVEDQPVAAEQAEKEERKLQRMLANRESARQAFLRKQTMHLELTRKAADMLEENENLKKEKLLAVEEYISLKVRNEFLKAQLAVIKKAEAGENGEEPKSSQGDTLSPHQGQEHSAENTRPGTPLVTHRSFQVDDTADVNVVSIPETTRHGLPLRNQEPIICPSKKPGVVFATTKARRMGKKFMKLKNIHELTRKAADMLEENENLRKEKELAVEYSSLKVRNEFLKAQLAVIKKAEAGETGEERKSSQLLLPQGDIHCSHQGQEHSAENASPENPLVTRSSIIPSHSGTNGRTKTHQRSKYSCSKNRLHEDNNQLSANHNMNSEASSLTKTVSGDNTHRAGLTLPPDSGGQYNARRSSGIMVEPGPHRSFQVITAEVNVVSTPGTTRHSLPERNQEPIFCPRKKPWDVFAASKARRRRKRFMKVKNMHCHDVQTRYNQLDDTADVNVVPTPETTSHGLPLRNQEPIICPRKETRDVFAATEARRRRKEFMKLKNVHRRDVQTHYQVDDKVDNVDSTLETTRHGLSQKNQEPIICPRKKPGNLVAAIKAQRTRKRKEFTILKNVDCHDVETRYQADDTADVNVVSTPSTTGHGLLQRNQEPIICPGKKPGDVFAAEARRRRKESMKLKTLRYHGVRTR